MPDDTVVSCAKTAEPIEMPFGLWARVGSKNHVLDGVQIPLCKGTIFRGEGIPRHVQQHFAVSPAKTAEPMEMFWGYGLG